MIIRLASKNAFTLIELLAVMAIIGILAALLLPALGAAKARSGRTACLNNLRQINYGIRMYSDDSNDAAPGPASAPRTNKASLYFSYKKLMKSYVGLNGASSSQDKLFACPADIFYPNVFVRGVTQPLFLRQSLHDQPVMDYSSYSFNGGDNVAINFGASNRFSVAFLGLGGLKLSSIKHPDKTVLVAETSAYVPWSWHDPNLTTQFFNDARNVVSFADGHASYIKINWNNTPFPGGMLSFAVNYNPPAGYDYQWSGD